MSILQPIVNYSLGNGWSLGASEVTITWDWERDDWASLPLGMSISKLTHPGKVPGQINAQYEYNFADDAVNAKSIFRLTAKFLFATG